jgi:kynurenine formamidase
VIVAGTAGPNFKELGARLSNWGRWGSDDELGTLNFITPECRVAAAALVRSGRTFDLGMSIDGDGVMKHGAIAGRFDAIHTMLGLPGEDVRPGGVSFADDMVVMALQSSTQWDSLAHVGYDGLLYNSVPASTITSQGAERNSIDKVVSGPLGRGVLLDIPRLTGERRLEASAPIRADDLESAAKRQGVEVRSGDVLCVRSGWYQHVLEGNLGMYMQQAVPGLEISCCEWLHDHEVAALASDTYCVEVKPSGQVGVTHPVHAVLIRDLGMTIGEIFNFEALVEDCAEDGSWEFLFVGLPLKLTGAVGSPLTPLAVK